jgi:GTP-binding protein EngB required for normal cell division
VLLTKSDKLNKTEAAKALSIVRLQAGGGDVKLFSSLKRRGVEGSRPAFVGLGASGGKAGQARQGRA